MSEDAPHAVTVALPLHRRAEVVVTILLERRIGANVTMIVTVVIVIVLAPLRTGN